ncbi:hypothetical protein MPSEU_001088000 [Mayamaea pseudoterrestris]|nr:hypothetical protein MPSEU_001088000 [Mayamaea pseudoterrestris]
MNCKNVPDVDKDKPGSAGGGDVNNEGVQATSSQAVNTSNDDNILEAALAMTELMDRTPTMAPRGESDYAAAREMGENDHRFSHVQLEGKRMLTSHKRQCIPPYENASFKKPRSITSMMCSPKSGRSTMLVESRNQSPNPHVTPHEYDPHYNNDAHEYYQAQPLHHHSRLIHREPVPLPHQPLTYHAAAPPSKRKSGSYRLLDHEHHRHQQQARHHWSLFEPHSRDTPYYRTSQEFFRHHQLKDDDPYVSSTYPVRRHEDFSCEPHRYASGRYPSGNFAEGASSVSSSSSTLTTHYTEVTPSSMQQAFCDPDT